MAKRKKQAAVDDAPRCAFGETTDAATGKAPGYEGAGHCIGCHAHEEASADAFDAAVNEGKYNRRGYTRNEWKAAGHDPAAWADAPPLDMGATEQIPVGEAMAQVADKVNGASTPTQLQLLELAKPFNFEGAWMDIEGKQSEVDELAALHEADAATAKKSKKALDEAQTLLGQMVNTYRARRLTKLREQLEQADRASAATVDAPPAEDRGSDAAPAPTE